MDLSKVEEILRGVTPGPWRADGEPWNQIVWSGADNRVCFMAHSNGLDDARDVATARFIAWCREGVPALLARIAAQEVQIAGLEAERDRFEAALARCCLVGGQTYYMERIDLAERRAEAAETALAAMTKERDELREELLDLNKQFLKKQAKLQRALAAERAKVAKLVEALKPFAEYIADGGDNDDKGEPLPDTQGVGWVYLTVGDFRRARAAITEAGQ